MTRTPLSRNALRAALLPAVALTAACSGPSSAVRPPAPVVVGQTVPADAPAPAATLTVGTLDADPAAVAVRTYLREQALAVNAGTADPHAVPAFTATLTGTARSWALPLLAANLGDRMPGPYPVGVLESVRADDDRVDLALCLQDRGWQVDRSTGQPLNQPRFSTARAVVLRDGGRWLVDDVVLDGGSCTSDDVVPERF